MPRVEEASYTFHEGNNWWVYETFSFKGISYAYLLREDPLRINYAKMESGELRPITNEEKRKVAERYQQILILRLHQEGKEAVPRVGKVKQT